MSTLPFFQVDAFAEAPLSGNPAAVMPLDKWLPDDVMQAIATENNLSETAFTVPSESGDADFDLRWFTPTAEVEMCGHATLASGHILMTSTSVRFSTKSGLMTVTRNGELLELDMRAAKLSEVREPALCAALGLPDSPVWLADGYN
jgi:PhzF family phenazine biosynthesis protein